MLASWAVGDPCTNVWRGVQCDGAGSVVGLVLTAMGLQGTLPTSLGTLSSLTVLVLFMNALSGVLPSEIGKLTSLTSQLGLRANRLSGTLPSEWGQLSRLTNIGLASNSVSGSVPSEWGGLVSLRRLALDFNSLRGTLPSQLASLAQVSTFTVNDNACLFGPVVSVGAVGTSYSTAGTALGQASAPASCNATQPLTPPPSAPGNVPPSLSIVIYDPLVARGANVTTIAGTLGSVKATQYTFAATSSSNFAAAASCSPTTSTACRVGLVADITLSPDGQLVYFVDTMYTSSSFYSAYVMALKLGTDVPGSSGASVG